MPNTETIKTTKRSTNGNKKKVPKVAETIAEGYSVTEDAKPQKLDIGYSRSCACPPTHINCMSPREWLKSQLGVWQFNYEARDVRDKKAHPATFPISLSRKIIELFTHEGELVLDPFVGSGTTLVAARDTNRNAVGFDLKDEYVQLCRSRLSQTALFAEAQQIAVQDDARHISRYAEPKTVGLIWTSPPYANLLNRVRKNKSRR